MPLRDRPALVGLFLVLCGAMLLAGCSAELDHYEQQRSARGSLGEEVYKALCRRIAGTEYPNDITGRRSQAICLGDAAQVRSALVSERHPPRLVALARRRTSIARSVDRVFGAALSDPLERMLRNLVPFYDLPDERVQWATRTLATVLERLAGDASKPADPVALEGLARLTAEGMAPVDASLGLPRALTGAAGLRDLAAHLGPLAHDDPAVKPAFEALLASVALELATSHDEPDDAEDVADLKDLLLRTHPDFASGKPLHVALRDARGLPVPAPLGDQRVPLPFVDADGDGAADRDGTGLRAHPSVSAAPATPFPAVDEPPQLRDAHGRALFPVPESAATRLLYRDTDLDATLLAAGLRVMRGLFDSDLFTRGLAGAMRPLIGDPLPAQQRYGALDYAYQASDPRVSPLRDLMHAAGALVDQPVYPEALQFSARLLREQEAPLVEALDPMLTLLRRTRPGDDAYPGASLRPGHTLWDELLLELEKVARRRIPAEGAAGDTLLEAMTRASLGFGRNLQKPGAPIEQVLDPELLRRQGGVLAALMRFKDEWRANPKGESARAPGEPSILGAFRTPVDRSLPDAPVTCGRDGCGGLVAGTPFARWAAPNQNCMLQRAGRPITGKDCGAPANQSIFQRSLGLIAEMAGRAQCNKQITIDALLASAAQDPCVGEIKPDSAACQLLKQQQALERQASIREAEATLQSYACPADAPATAPCRAYAEKYPAAFVDPDGPAGATPASIRACHLLDLPDVGRTFGAVLLRQYALEFPNPWVRRYLEDIARAGDHDGDGAQDLPSCTREGGFANFPIVDPAVPPACVTEAAKLSRDLYKNLPRSVDTLGELVAFLLDDSRLFATEEDMRALRPDAKALSRVLFAAGGEGGFLMFDPLLVRGAPPLCAARGELPECVADDSQPMPAGGCCIADPAHPPLRYRIDTYYGATTFAWEQTLRLRDGRTLSFLDTLQSLTDAVTRYDFDQKRGDDPRNFEDLGYPFSALGKLFAEHYDTASNPLAQDRDPAAPHYRRLTGVASYEALMADALDDGSVALDQLGPDGHVLFDASLRLLPEQQLGLLFHAQPLLLALDAMAVGSGDGIDFSAELAEQLLNPHARCAGAGGDRRVLAGQGACDRAQRGEPGHQPPLAFRDGRLHVCHRDGRCFDGKQQPRRYPAPAHQLVGALLATADRQRREPARAGALRSLLGGLAEGLLATRDGRFADRRAPVLLTTLLAYAAEEVEKERVAGTLSSLRARTDADLDALLREPLMATLLGFADALHGKEAALGGLASYARSLLAEGDADDSLRPLIAGLFDGLQMLPAAPQTHALMHALASGFGVDVEALVRQGGSQESLAPSRSAAGRNLFVLSQAAKHDGDAVLARVMHNLSSASPEGEHAPMEVLLDVALEVDRVVPGAGGAPDAADLETHLRRISSVMRDDQRGFERLFQLLRCSTSPSTADCE